MANPPVPACSSRQALAGLSPAPVSGLHMACAHWNTKLACCSIESVNTLVQTRLNTLALSPTCWPEHVGKECAVACDPDGANWDYIGPGTPKLCMATCHRYFQSCLANGAQGSYGTFPNSRSAHAPHLA